MIIILFCCSISILVVQASGECLRDVLASKSGSAVMAKLEEDMDISCMQWYQYLQPFKPQKRRGSHTEVGLSRTNRSVTV